LDKRPNAALYKRSGLEITDTEGRLSQREEQYMGRWSARMPGVAGSERAFVTYLNILRADTFDAMAGLASRNGTITEGEAKAIANYVNVATGRGDLGMFRQAAQFLATVLWSPRLALSRFQYIALQPLWAKGNTARTRKAIALEYAKTLTGITIFFATAAAALYNLLGAPGDDEDWNIEIDPRSSDFGRLRIGEVRIAPLAGLEQSTTLLARLVTGETKGLRTGEIVPIRGVEVPFGRSTGAEVVGRYLRNKLAPVLGTGLNILSGENVMGEPVSPKTVARDLTIPLSLREIFVFMKEYGVPAGTALQMLETLGVSTQHYDNIYSGPFGGIRGAVINDDFETYKKALGNFVDAKLKAGIAPWASYQQSLRIMRERSKKEHKRFDAVGDATRARQWWFDAYDEVVAPRLENR
jgi:hypothetical protein